MIDELVNHQGEAAFFPSIDQAINKMIDWLEKYQDEAVNCEAIVLSTVLHPRFRGKFFNIHYPNYEVSSQVAIEAAYSSLVEESEHRDPTPSPDGNDQPAEADAFDIFGDHGTSNSSTSELDDYLKGHCPIRKDQTPLEWWGVCSSVLEIVIVIT